MPSPSPEPPAGATRDEAIAAARAEYGPDVRIRGVRRIRSGGVAGFFSQERYVADVVLPAGADEAPRTPAGKGTAPAKGSKPAGRPAVAPARPATPTVVAEVPAAGLSQAEALSQWPSSGLSVDDLLEVALQVRGAQRAADETPTGVLPVVDPVDELADLLGAGGDEQVATYSPASLARPAAARREDPRRAEPRREDARREEPRRGTGRPPLATRREPEPAGPTAPAWERTSRTSPPTATPEDAPGADPASDPASDPGEEAGGTPPSPFAAALMRVVTQDDEVQAAVADAEQQQEEDPQVAAHQEDVPAAEVIAPRDRAAAGRSAAVRAAALRAEAEAVASARADIARAEAAAAAETPVAALPAASAPASAPVSSPVAAPTRAADPRPAPAVTEPADEADGRVEAPARTRTPEERRAAARARAEARRAARVAPTRPAALDEPVEAEVVEAAEPGAAVEVAEPGAPRRSSGRQPARTRRSSATRQPAAPRPAPAEPAAPVTPAAPVWDATSIIELAPRAGMPAAAKRPPAPAAARPPQPSASPSATTAQVAQPVLPAQPGTPETPTSRRAPAVVEPAAGGPTKVTSARAGAAALREAAIRAAGELAERQVVGVQAAPDLLDDFVDADLAATTSAGTGTDGSVGTASGTSSAPAPLADRAARLRSVLAAATSPTEPVTADAGPPARRHLPAAPPAASGVVVAEHAVPSPAEEAAAEEAAAEQAAAEKAAAEAAAAEQAEAAAQEAARVEAARVEAERVEAERVEAERIAAAQAEARRIAELAAEAARAAAEAARVQAARVEAERRAAVEAARIEVARIEAEQAQQAQARRAAEAADAARLAAADAVPGGTAPVGDRAGGDRSPHRTRAERREAAEAARARLAGAPDPAAEVADLTVDALAEDRPAAEVPDPDVPAVDPLWGTPVRRPLAAVDGTDGGRHRGAAAHRRPDTGLMPAVHDDRAEDQPPVRAAATAQTGTAAHTAAPAADAVEPVVGVVLDAPRTYTAGSRYDEILFGSPRSTPRPGASDALEALRAAALAGGVTPSRRRRAPDGGRHRSLPTQVDLPAVGAARLTALDDPSEATSGFIEVLQAVADSDFLGEPEPEASRLAAEVPDVLVQEMAHEMAAGMAEELARTASDPSPRPADATSVLPSLEGLLPAAPRVRGQRPPVPATTPRSRLLPPHPSTRMRGVRGTDDGDGYATITHLVPVSDDPAPAEGAAGLAALGVPASVLGADFAAEAGRRGTFAALASSLGRALPAAPAIPAEPGDVLVVVGPGAEALTAARALAVALRLDPAQVQWCTRGALAGLAAVDVQVSGAAAATERRAVAGAADVPTVVAVDVPLGDAGGAWAAQMVHAWSGTAVWAVLDSTRKPGALRSWLAELPRVDAVVVTDTDAAPDPAALLDGLPVPVAVVDGARATPHRWAALLCERLAGHR
ncbi:hypothetical protein TEK04_03225 [Klenkia sp. LSe6-5]|uniref:Uncharacterized protein n=1 Tax=Klenkia sesuvii TaxID=3103137 RepID=A0ABU8DPE6_9ACTN